MKYSKAIFVFLVVLMVDVLHAGAAEWTEERVLWFNTPSSRWEEALPVGNGRLGAMVLGTYPEERIQLNEDSIWCQSPMMRASKSYVEGMKIVQELVDAGKYEEADGAYQTQVGVKKLPRVGSYQTMGDLWLKHVGTATLKTDGYRRDLDLATGLATVTQRLSDGSVITEEVICTAIDNCIAIRLTTTSPKGLNFDASITRPFKEIVHASANGNDELVLEDQALMDGGKYPGTKFHTVLKALPVGGSVKSEGNLLQVRKAKSVTLLLTCATNYNRENPQAPFQADWQKKARQDLDKVIGKPWGKLAQDSANDISSFMYRCELELGDTPSALQALPIDQRLTTFAKTKSDLGLMEIYFQYGRYLLVSSSRPGTLPANLQGLWAQYVKNPWNCDYHLDINVQMSYWLAGPTDLAEFHEPFLWLMDMLRTEGRHMAKAFGAKGFCTALSATPFGRTLSVHDKPIYGGSRAVGPWGVTHMMEQYRFTGDMDYLKNTAFPVIKECSEFIQSWVVRSPTSGKLVGKASCSHEISFTYTDESGGKRNGTLGPATAYDLGIFRQVLSDYLEAAAVLEINDAFTVLIKKTLGELEYPRIGSEGTILEWGVEEVTEKDIKHRHLSHLVGFHPCEQITKKKTPELFDAAVKSLHRRGDKKMGWSQSWKVNCYARALDGNAAVDQFNQQLIEQTLPNLMNMAGKVMIMDGNYATTAGIIEMILQSHDDELHLLPALPDSWKDGSVKGIKARGNFTVNLSWKNGKLERAKIISNNGGPLTVRYAGKTTTQDTVAGQEIVLTSTN